MTKSDQALVSPADIPVALALLTRLPVPANDFSRSANAAWAYPVVGLVVGALAALGGSLAHYFGLPTPLTALISLSILIISTGAMHEDGLADTADGLWGGHDPARRLEIMKDSRIGAYGVIALILGISARWAALWLLYEIGPGVATAAILASAALSRATMPALMATLPHARSSGLSQGVGQVSHPTALLAIAIGAIATLLLTGSSLFGALFWAALVTFILAQIARAKIGGQTGDILGATQQITEIAILFSIIA